MSSTIRWLPLIVATLIAALTLTYIAGAVATPSSAGAVASKRDKGCDDFKSQKKAQRFFKKHNPNADPHYLDADGDRIACEDNPCPCTRKWHQQHGRVFAVRRL